MHGTVIGYTLIGFVGSHQVEFSGTAELKIEDEYYLTPDRTKRFNSWEDLRDYENPNDPFAK